MKGQDPVREGAGIEMLVLERGITRKELAARMNTDEGELSKIFNGKRVPSYHWLVRLGGVLYATLADTPSDFSEEPLLARRKRTALGSARQQEAA